MSLKKLSLLVGIALSIVTIIILVKTNFFSQENKEKKVIKIKGYVYKNSKNIPFKGAIVIIKELQTEIPPKVVSDNGFYISAPIKKNLMSSLNNKFDFTIQVKFGDSIFLDQTKTINFDDDEVEPSFGDMIIRFAELPINKTPLNKKSTNSKSIKATIVKGDINQVN